MAVTLNYSAPSRGAEYCDKHVCLSVCVFVCPRSYLRKVIHARSSPNVCACYRCKRTLKPPPYLTYLLASYTPGRSLRSQDKHLLLEPTFSTVIGSRGFSYTALSTWNKLSLEMRNNSSFASFQRNLRHIAFPCLLLDQCLANFPPSDCPRLRCG